MTRMRRRRLGEGEEVVVRMRTHGKALIGPVVVLLLLAALGGFAIALMPADLQPFGPFVVVAVLGLGVLAWVVRPFLRWLSSTYTLTTRRMVTRTGILTRRGHDVALNRVNNVASERTLLDRMLGCGTLVLNTASDAAPIVLKDIPDAERVQLLMNDLIFGLDEADLPAALEQADPWQSDEWEGDR